MNIQTIKSRVWCGWPTAEWRCIELCCQNTAICCSYSEDCDCSDKNIWWDTTIIYTMSHEFATTIVMLYVEQLRCNTSLICKSLDWTFNLAHYIWANGMRIKFGLVLHPSTEQKRLTSRNKTLAQQIYFFEVGIVMC